MKFRMGYRKTGGCHVTCHIKQDEGDAYGTKKDG